MATLLSWNFSFTQFGFSFTHPAPHFPHLLSRFCVNFMHLLPPLLSLTWWRISVPSLSVFRFVPEVVSSGPAGGQLVPQFPVSREDNEVIQLYAGQQSPSAPYIHARHVVRHTQTAKGLVFWTNRYADVLGFVEQKARGRSTVIHRAFYVHTHWS